MLGTLMRILERRDAPRHALYFGAFAVDETDLPVLQIDISAYPGLALLHVVQTADDAPRVLTYWTTREQFEYSRHRLGSVLQALPQISHGSVIDVRARSVPLWRRVSLYTVLLAAVGFLSGVKGLADHFDWLFSHTDLKIDVVEKTPVRVQAGAESSIKLSLTNPLSIAQTDIQVAALLGRAGNTHTIIPVPDGVISNLPANSSRTVSLPLTIRNPGHYALQLEVRGKAGWLRWPAAQRTALAVEAWAASPVATVSAANTVSSTGVLQLRIVSARGAPSGLECELTISRIPGLDFDGADATWIPNNAPGAEVGHLTFTVDRTLAAFFEIHRKFSFQAATPIDWSGVASQAVALCRPIEEDGENE